MFKEKNEEINFIDLTLAKNFNFKINITGFFKSRLSYLFIGIFSIKPLYTLLKKEKPDYLVVHLLTFIPFILLILFNFETKFILRISGYPKMNLFRMILWKMISKKIYKVFSPTKETMNALESKGIFDKESVEQSVGEAGLIEEVPVFTCKSSDVSDATFNDTFVIDTVTYYIKEILPDGTGVTRFTLSG